MTDPDYAPETAYFLAVNDFDQILSDNPDELEEVVEMLSARMVEAINGMEMSDDEDEAEAQMRNTVLRLSTVAFLAGSIWKEMMFKGEPLTDDELSVVLTPEQKLELTRSLLNGEGISLKIL